MRFDTTRSPRPMRNRRKPEQPHDDDGELLLQAVHVIAEYCAVTPAASRKGAFLANLLRQCLAKMERVVPSPQWRDWPAV